MVWVGEGSPQSRNVVATMDSLRYHQLQSALHEVRTLLRESGAASTQQHPALSRLLGVSNEMVMVRSLLDKVAKKDVPVLLLGEAGTGKEHAARALHAASPRSNRSFVPLNCGAIQPELLESELFGHERGAFVGALSGKAGRIELADGGTLFIEELGALDYPLQLKLLRVLQNRQVTRLGAEHPRSVDVRVVISDQGKLERLVESGELRDDLYYHLSVYPVEIPALRERAEDIPVLVESLCAEIEREQRLMLTLSVDVLAMLGRQAWPGNIRELRNLLQRLAIQCRDSVVTTRDLPGKFRESSEPNERPVVAGQVVLSEVPEAVRLPVNGLDLKDYLSRLERSLIEQALDDADAVVARAADRLHVRRTTLVEKMRKYGITR
jgi:sigma-54 specific flagellar transcriptional regulator A